MGKIEEKLTKYLQPISEKLGQNKYLLAVSTGLIRTLPFNVIGSLFILFAFFPIPAYTDWLSTMGIQSILNTVGRASISIVGLMASYLIANHLAKLNNINEVNSGMLSLASFILLMPHEIVIEDATVLALDFNFLGASGLFVAIIVSIITVEVYKFILKKGLIIKLPDTVPTMVSESFQPIIATFIIFTLWLLVRTAFMFSSFDSIFNFIGQIIEKPILTIGGSMPGLIVIFTIVNLFWFFGIHPSAITSIMSPILTTLSLQNLEAFQNGEKLPNMSADVQTLWSIGGTGSTLALVLLMLFFSKSSRLKTMGRLTIIPTIFNINEPVVFGVPVVLNPVLFVPLILSTPISGGITWIALRLGLVDYSRGISLPFTIPTFMFGFINGGIKMLILVFVILLAMILLYFPFFKVLDKTYLLEEQADQTKDDTNA